MILNRSLPIRCTHYVIAKMKERFLTYDLLAIQRVMQKGKAIYDPDSESWRVTNENITIAVKHEKGQKSKGINLVITVFFSESSKQEVKRMAPNKKRKHNPIYHKLKKKLEPTIESEGADAE